MIKAALFVFPFILPLALTAELRAVNAPTPINVGLDDSGGNADPGFEQPGSFHIVPDSFPGIVGINTEIDVYLGNYGTEQTNGTQVMLAYNDWGVTFSGWQEIDTKAYTVWQGTQEMKTFEYVFTDRAHVCLQANVTKPGPGGNTNTNNDRTQINWEVVHADEADGFDMWIPFRNNDVQRAIKIEPLDIQCLGDNEIVACNDDGRDPPRFLGNGMPPGLEPNQEQAAFVRISNIPDEGKVIVVQARMNGEVNNVMIQVVKTTVEELLNFPHLCCLESSVELRVKLESLLVKALIAYREEKYKEAIEILSDFVQQATMEECDLSNEEIACVEKAILKIVDAGLMIARKCGLKKSPDPSEEELKAALGDPFFFRRAGLYAASLLEAARVCN